MVKGKGWGKMTLNDVVSFGLNMAVNMNIHRSCSTCIKPVQDKSVKISSTQGKGSGGP